MVGWFSLGLNSSGPEEAQHFNDMRDAANINGQVGKCDLIARWHVLMVRLAWEFLFLFKNFFHHRIPDSTSRGCPQGATVWPTSWSDYRKTAAWAWAKRMTPARWTFCCRLAMISTLCKKSFLWWKLRWKLFKSHLKVLCVHQVVWCCYRKLLNLAMYKNLLNKKRRKLW